MKNTSLLVCILLLVGFSEANAQTSALTIEIPVTIPLGNSADFIDQTAIRGINLEYQYFISSEFAIGGEIGHTTLYHRETSKVYTEGSASLSGIQYRYQYAYPILATGAYFLNSFGNLKPFAGLGIGTIAQVRRVDMGIFSRERSHWQFGIRPEIGVIFEPSPYVGFKLGAKYYSSAESTNLEGQSNLGINVGLVFLR